MTYKNELNREVFISALGLGILYYFFPRAEILWIGGIYIILCFSIMSLKEFNHKFWKRLGKIIQSITSPIIFGVIFFLLLLTLGFLFRVFKKKRDQENTTFKIVNQTVDASYFDVPW